MMYAQSTSSKAVPRRIFKFSCRLHLSRRLQNFPLLKEKSPQFQILPMYVLLVSRKPEIWTLICASRMTVSSRVFLSLGASSLVFLILYSTRGVLWNSKTTPNLRVLQEQTMREARSRHTLSFPSTLRRQSSVAHPAAIIPLKFSPTRRGSRRRTKDEVSLFVTTKTAPKNFLRRSLVRDGWLATSRAEAKCHCDLANTDLCTEENAVCTSGRLTWTHRFVTGTKGLDRLACGRLDVETDSYGDFIPYPHKESYEFLTEKLVWLMSFLARSVESEYFLMLDDDCYVQMWRVASYLFSAPRQGLYAGHIKSRRTKVGRHWWNKFPVSYHKLNLTYYPPYPNGAGVFLSRDVQQLANRAAQRWPPQLRFSVEDAFLGVLLNFSGVTAENIPQIYTNGAYKLLGCRGDKTLDWTQPLIVAGDEQYIQSVMEARAGNKSLCVSLDGPFVSVARLAILSPARTSLTCTVLLSFLLLTIWYLACKR